MKQSRFTWKTNIVYEAYTEWTVQASDSLWFAQVCKWDVTIWENKDCRSGIHRFKLPAGATFEEIQTLVESGWSDIECYFQRRTQKAK
jgi:hypothetical protein